jgi:hypothetical protein
MQYLCVAFFFCDIWMELGMARVGQTNRFDSGLVTCVFTIGLALVITVGCARHYGGSTFTVNFTPAPDGNRAYYLIPDQVWTVYPDSFRPDPSDPGNQDLNVRLMQYRVHDDGTKDVDTITYDVVVWNHEHTRLIVIDQITPREPNHTFKISPDRADGANQ